jgi:hypothetical protein
MNGSDWQFLANIPRDALAVIPDGVEFVRTSELVESMAESFPQRWTGQSAWGRELTVQRFGRYMATVHGIRSTKNNLDQRGYRVSELRRVAL